MSELTSASLDCYRRLRDAVGEAAFFQIYGNLFAFYLGDKSRSEAGTRRAWTRASFRSSRKRWRRSTRAATRRRSRGSPS